MAKARWRRSKNKHTLELGDGVSYEIHKDPHEESYRVQMVVIPKLKSGYGQKKITIMPRPAPTLKTAKHLAQWHWDAYITGTPETQYRPMRRNFEYPSLGKRRRSAF